MKEEKLKASASFLKKRSKKRLFNGGSVTAGVTSPRKKEFFCFFFCKKRSASVSQTLSRFAAERRAVTAVEFSLNILALLIFFFGIINLGDLGLVLGTMNHAVQSTARDAAVQTGADIAATGNVGDCATEAQVLATFNGLASPILPLAGATANNNAPIVQSSWANNAQGATLTVFARYQWVPVGMPNTFTPAVALTVSSTQTVLGTSGANTTCD